MSATAADLVVTDEAYDERIKKILLQAKGNAYGAVAVASNTINDLEIQNEKLVATEDTIEANEYVVLKSLRTLRGMTWSGMFYNMVTGDVAPQINSTRERHSPPPPPPPSSSSSSSSSHNSTTANLAVYDSRDRSTLFDCEQQHNNSDIRWRTVPDEADNHLNEISSVVANLKDMTLSMSQQLNQQTSCLDRIDHKSGVVNDQLLGVTLKATQLTVRNRRTKIEFVGKYQFIQDSTRKYLSVYMDDIVLISKADKSTFFDVYAKENNLFGLQNCKTLKFIGSTIWMQIRCSGYTFGKQEELYIKLDSPATNIFVLGINFGGGGWLRDDSSGKILTQVTSGVTDKKDALFLRPVFISDEQTKENEVE